MAKITNFRLNTHFTALKQINQAFRGSLSFPGRTYGFILGETLARTTISVPAGIYVENALIRTSLDNNINHVYHDLTISLSALAYVNIAINQTNNTTYEFVAVFSNTGDTVTVPAFTAEAILRLAIAPFEV